VTRQIAAQTRQYAVGLTPDGASRRVSLRELDARPIAIDASVSRSSSAIRPVVDNDDGVVLNHSVRRQPTDAPRLAPAIERVIMRTGRRPRTVTTERRQTG
jgi:IS5 family transposase